jgi:hypothetical protein
VIHPAETASSEVTRPAGIPLARFVRRHAEHIVLALAILSIAAIALIH